MEVINNYGILASISWNSNNWQGNPSKDDLKRSNYDYVKGNQHMHESLNFGHTLFPVEKDGCYIGYTPVFFNRLPDPKNSKQLSIIFFTSSDYANDNRKCIVGFYGFPKIDSEFKRKAKHALYQKYDGGNVRAKRENIVYLENPIVIDNNKVATLELLPQNKQISKQGFNYLHSNNVVNILHQAALLNPTDKSLRSFLKVFPLYIGRNKKNKPSQKFGKIVEDLSPDTKEEIEELERRMKDLTPKMKERVSSYIERGAIASKIKRLTGFKCVVCDALGMNPIGFKKINGDPYIETHHVEPVHKLTKNSLSSANLMTICANHHRQMHYGDAKLIGQDDSTFWFEVDGYPVKVGKMNI